MSAMAVYSTHSLSYDSEGLDGATAVVSAVVAAAAAGVAAADSAEAADAAEVAAAVLFAASCCSSRSRWASSRVTVSSVANRERKA